MSYIFPESGISQIPSISISHDIIVNTGRLKRPMIVIADIHAHLIHLHTLIEQALDIEPDADITLTGDLIDNGPHNIETLSYVIDLQYQINKIAGRRRMTILPGNHEQRLAGTLNKKTADIYSGSFVSRGGHWVVDIIRNPTESVPKHSKNKNPLDDLITAHLSDNAKKVLGKSGDTLLSWLHKLPLSSRTGRVLMVHGGIHPDKDPDKWIGKHTIAPETVDHETGPLWIREPFISHKGSFKDNSLVLHGHTIMNDLATQARHSLKTGKPVVVGHHKLHRLGLDSGSYKTGVVTAAIITQDRIRTLHSILPV